MDGIGVMLGQLCGDRGGEAFVAAMNKKIIGLSIQDDQLMFDFEDGTGLVMWDDGQSCCEHRYMVCDDDLGYYLGSTFLGGELVDGGYSEEDWESKECEFLKINTSKGVFTVANYNVHNGYYGGFWIRSKFREGQEA